MIFVYIFFFLSVKSLSRTWGSEIRDFGAREGMPWLCDVGYWMAVNSTTNNFIMSLPFLFLCGYIQARCTMYDEGY